MTSVRVEDVPVKDSSVKFFKYRVEGLPDGSRIFKGERIGVIEYVFRAVEESGAREIVDLHTDAAVNQKLRDYAAEHGISYNKPAE